jgi:NAD(P)-dependent dehydrogenase (short-subunit alcohol dehydrogenase family)
MSPPPGVAGLRVLVTGSTGGLGLAMARALYGAGARVLLTGRDAARVERARGSLGAGPGEAHGCVLDVRDEGSIRAVVAQAVERWGGLDVLVNNAGIGMRTVNPRFLTEPQPFWAVTPQGFRDVVDTNLTGYFLVAREVVPLLLRQGAGRIVNISMNHETMRRRGFVPYGPSRAGAESLSHIMAQDLAPHGITVNMLLPGGATDTGMIPEGFPAEARAGLLSPDVMAEPILFLCSDEARGLSDARIVARDFAAWREEWRRTGAQ